MDAVFLKMIEKQIRLRIGEIEADRLVSSESRSTVELDQQSVGRLSRMDALQQQAMANASDRSRQAEIHNLRGALSRIDSGEYGYCQDCGELISKDRLQRAPTAPKCLDCARG